MKCSNGIDFANVCTNIFPTTNEPTTIGMYVNHRLDGKLQIKRMILNRWDKAGWIIMIMICPNALLLFFNPMGDYHFN